MDYQNNNQPQGGSFCPVCGAPLENGAMFCSSCGANLSDYAVQPENVAAAPVNPAPVNPAPAPVNTFEQAYVPAPPVPPANNPNPPKKKKGKKLLLILIPILLILFLFFVGGIVFLWLIGSHTICFDHDFADADCTNARTCIYCDATDGEALGHDWIDATCEEDQYCDRCGEIGDKATGHNDGTWTVISQPTFDYSGTEELRCTNCEELLDTRTIPKKVHGVEGNSFNFNDQEFIKFFNDKSNAYINPNELGLSDSDSDLTSYDITYIDGSEGLIMLEHNSSGNVSKIVVVFKDYTSSCVVTSFIASKLDSRFDTKAAGPYIVTHRSYTSAGMTISSIDLESAYASVLSPSAQWTDST